ncbi:MAG: hypothetical protein ACRC3Z_07020, partial [Phocaeicola sp.]
MAANASLTNKLKSEKRMSMFCFQCQEAAGGKGCSISGVCGKSPEVANLQDLLVFLLKGISHHTVRMREEGIPVSAEVNHFVMESLFMTITNANFDKERFVARVTEAIELRNKLATLVPNKVICPHCDCTTWEPKSVA